MAYDPDKDKMIKNWKCEETGLMVSINRYGDGEPKVRIRPWVLMKKDGTERAPAKAGRLSVEDVLWLYDIIDEVKEKLSAMRQTGMMPAILSVNENPVELRRITGPQILYPA